MGAPPHLVSGQYHISDSKVELIPESCKIYMKSATSEEIEYAKKIEPDLCARRLGPTLCSFKFVRGKDYKKELLCSEQTKVPNADSKELKALTFGNYELKREKFRDCIIPNKKN